MHKSVNINQIEPQTTFMIEGTLTYSRLAKQINGEELEKDKARRNAKGWNPIDRPYTTATVCNASVMYLDPNNKRPEEIYAEESLYQSKSESSTGWCFTGYNKGKYLPYIAELDQSNNAQEIKPKGELASGLPVILVMRVFKARPNNGLSLDGVIIKGKAEYYNSDASGLAERGITFKPLPDFNREADTQNVQTQNTQTTTTQPQVNIPTVPPVNQPQQIPPTTQTPYSAQPMPQQQAPQYPYSAQPEPQYQPQPDAASQPGIRYDPNVDRNYR